MSDFYDDSGVSFEFPDNTSDNIDQTLDENGNVISTEITPVDETGTATEYDPTAADQSNQADQANQDNPTARAGGGSGGPSLNRTGQSKPPPFQTSKPAVSAQVRVGGANPYGNPQPRPDAPPIRVQIPIGDRSAMPNNGLAPIYRTVDRGVYDPSLDYGLAYYGANTGRPNPRTAGAVANAGGFGGIPTNTLLALMGGVIVLVLLTRN